MKNGERSIVVLGDCIIPFLFQGQHYDYETGLVRYISEDPIELVVSISKEQES